MQNNKSNLSNKLKLYLQLLSDFQTYKSNYKEKDKLIAIPHNVKETLYDIMQSPIFTVFLINNEAIKAENRRKEKELKEKRLLEGKDKEEIEDEDFTSNEKLIRFKRARNATCFGQRTINIINQYYNSINEMILIKNDICEIMYDIEKEAFELSIQINIENEDKENKFIFINPKNINAKRGRSERGVKLSKYQKNSNFTSVDEYRKIFKNEINQRSLSITENNKEQTQYEMLLETLDKKNKILRKNKRNFPLLTSPTSPTKDTNATKKSNNIMNKTNRTRLKIYLPSITKLNKDIKYQTEKAKLNRKKNIIPLKSKALAYVSDYNYGVVFKNQNISPQTYV